MPLPDPATQRSPRFSDSGAGKAQGLHSQAGHTETPSGAGQIFHLRRHSLLDLQTDYPVRTGDDLADCMRMQKLPQTPIDFKKRQP